MIYGIDLGNLKSRVAVTRRGGVDVILNEISQRDSASYISYGDKERFIGEKGFDQAVRNQKNTVNNIKRFLGMQSDCPTLEYEKSFLSCPIVAAEDQSHEMEFVVQYKGEKHNFRPQQCLAALLGKLHSFVELDSISNGGPPVKGTDCVISCPVYFTSTQRRALLQAVEIAGLHCMALMNEPTACALDYGIFKSANFPEFDEKKLGSVVLFADIGHSATTISAVSFWKTSMKMLGSVYNVNLGTREIDNILLHHFRKEICDKYKIDVFENSKARFRLLQAIEKMKVMLSANPVSNLNVECLMNDIDVSFQNIKREDLEEMIAERFLRPFEELCAEAQRTFESYISPQTPIEIIGGGSRMPSVKTIIAKVFGLTPSVTLVATESIAKGCAILAAMLSPKFKVRDYVIQDKTLWNVDLGYWAQNPSNPAHVSFLSKEVVNKVVPLFKKGEAYPKSLDITFERSEPFDLHYFYDESDGANCIKSRIGSRGLHLGHIRLGNIVSPVLGNNAQAIGPLKVKVRFRMSFTGLIEIENAYVVQEYEENPENSKQGGTCEEKETGKEEKKSTKRKEARSEATREALLINCMDPETLQIAIKQEQDMVRADRLIFETLEAKNALEGYMYDNSSKLASGGELNSFTSPENIALFTQLSREYEEWLWGDGEDSAKDEYTDRLAKLQNIVEPSRKRYINAEYIPHEKDEFNRQLNVFQEKIEALIQSDATKEEIGWIKKEEIEKAEVVIMEARQWCEKEFSNYMQQSKYEIPQFTAETIKERMRVVTSSVQPIISRPRPNPTTSGKEPSATSGDSGEKAPDAPHETTQNAEVD